MDDKLREIKKQCEWAIDRLKGGNGRGGAGVPLTKETGALVKHVPYLLAELERLQTALDAANEVIEQTDNTLRVIDEATDYVKPGTGIWHAIGIARERIKEWRGVKGE